MPTNYVPGLTSIITERAYIFLESNNLLPKVQKGCRRRSNGSKDQQSHILGEVRSKRRNLSVIWIDCKKAFDNVPHTWIVKALLSSDSSGIT